MIHDVDEVAKIIERRMLREAELEGGPGSGPQKGGGGKQKYVPAHIQNRRDEIARNQRHDKAERGRRAALKKSAKGDNSTRGILRQRGYDV